MSDFNVAFSATMGVEGGYADVRADRGGETYRGISRVMHSDWPGWGVIDRAKKDPRFPANLSGDGELQDAVKQFYRGEFWDPLHCDAIRSQEIANELFDTAVNMGVAVAGKFLQRALNVMNRGRSFFPDLVVDGKIGPATLSALSAIVGEGSAGALLTWMNVLQGYRYVELMERDPSQEGFARGWAKRVILSKAVEQSCVGRDH